MDPYTFDFMVKDRIRELEGEAAGLQRIAMGRKRHLSTWLTAVVHLWSSNAAEVPVPSSEGCLEPCSDVKDHEHGLSA